jgi:glycosyltransferase involved in cell wall biosynthesis
MKVLNVNSFLDSKTGGGTAERTFQMSRHLSLSGVECTVLTTNTEFLDDTRISKIKPAKVIALPLLLKRFFVPRVSWKKIRNLVNSVDIIHLMGHWSFLNSLVYIAARKANKPYVVCPAGSLAIFGRSKLLKKIYNLILGDGLIRNASGWIAINNAELKDFDGYGIDTKKVKVIVNGVSEKDFLNSISVKDFRNKYQLSELPIILFMGRLNVIKGPDLLLEAFGEIQHDINRHQLVFAGTDEGMKDILVDKAKQYNISERIRFLGFINGREKTTAYKAAKLLVIPSRKEAMSIVALEAGVCGATVMLTNQCGFDEIKKINKSLEVKANMLGIANGLKYVLNHQNTIDRFAQVFHELVLKKYTWNILIIKYIKMYNKILICK